MRVSSQDINANLVIKEVLINYNLTCKARRDFESHADETRRTKNTDC